MASPDAVSKSTSNRFECVPGAVVQTRPMSLVTSHVVPSNDTYASSCPSSLCVTSTRFGETGEYMMVASLTGEPAVASSVSEPQLPEPAEFHSLILGQFSRFVAHEPVLDL
ncbi:Uncharacterised protein [uncultured archaeon]|nr:Uncharacterised protein [uncultured archaeon]